MKKICLIVLLFCITNSIGLASNPNAQSLINNECGFWVKPEIKLTKIGDQMSGLAGFQLGPSFGHSFYIGIAGYGLLNNVEAKNQNVKTFGFWDAGVVMDYTFFHNKLIHPSLGLFMGYGQLTPENNSNSANLFIADPGINVMINICSGLEFGLGCSYRFVTGSNFIDLSDSSLSGITGSIFIRWTEE